MGREPAGRRSPTTSSGVVVGARTLADRDHLRDGVTLAKATDIMWICTSPELYELLVRRRGWSPRQFGQFIADVMAATLLPR